MEAALREGKADLRADDVFPCIRCSKCHVPSLTGDWFSFCTVDPLALLLADEITGYN